MQQAHGMKVRPNSGKNPGVLRAKTMRTSRHSSSTSRSGRSNSRTSVKSASRTSRRSAKSKASVTSKTSGRARSAGSSRRGSSNVPKRLLLSPAGTAQAKAKVVVEAAAEDVTTATRARPWGQKKGKGHKGSRDPSRPVAATDTGRDAVPCGSATQKSTWVPS